MPDVTILGQIYVIEFATGMVKVGMSKNAPERCRQHERDASRFGVTVTNRWHSRPHADHHHSERALIRWCRNAPGATLRAGAEYFDGINFAEAVAFGHSLSEIDWPAETFVPPTLPRLSDWFAHESR